MIYILWKNYDETRMESFVNQKKAEGRIAELAELERKEDYGTAIVSIIVGEEVSYKVVKEIDKVEIVPKREV